MRYSFTAVLIFLTTTFTLLPQSANAQVEWSSGVGGNGHFYQLVPELLTWEEARIAAGTMTFNGFTGHLATLTSAAENAFVASTFTTTAWIGLFQLTGSVEPDGGFQWATGEPLVFTNWDDEEPNDLGGEAYVEALLGNVWNDATPQTTNFYYVEFGPPTSGSVAPEPAPAALIALGTVPILRRVRRRKISSC